MLQAAMPEIRRENRDKRAASGHVSSLPRGVRDIARAVAGAHGLTLADLIGPDRPRALVEARREACWLAAALSDRSIKIVSRVLERDHATVHHHLRMMERRGFPYPRLAGAAAGQPGPVNPAARVLAEAWLASLIAGGTVPDARERSRGAISGRRS